VSDGLSISEDSGDITKQYPFKPHQHQAADRRTTGKLIRILLGEADELAYEILPQSPNRYPGRLWLGRPAAIYVYSNFVVQNERIRETPGILSGD